MPFVTSVNCLDARCGFSVEVVVEGAASDSYYVFQCPVCQKRYLLWSKDFKETAETPPGAITARRWDEPSSCPLPQKKPDTPPRTMPEASGA